MFCFRTLQVTASDIHGIATRKVFVKRNTGAFAERAITYTAPDRWIFNAPLVMDW
jgi:hypothetical protein